ncbi:MAG: penicillin-binding transpeptidase domain-containing protein [Anaerolineales bacterium]|jgi:penicillin-binding protein 2|nr:penicillin-binding transpeptidase domain-containing protein [Anaerolineales bacterium]
MNTNSLPRANLQPWRAWVLYGAFFLASVFIVMRLFSLTILEFDLRQAQSDDNRTRQISDPAPRGIIYDRNGIILARNVASYNIVITPAYQPDDISDIQEIYRQLSALTGVPVNNGTLEEAKLFAVCVPGPGIAQLVELGNSNSPYSPVPIQCNVSQEVALTVREKAVDWPGVGVEIEPVRDYPTGVLTSTFVGFLGPIPATQVEFFEELGFVARRDKVGYSGVEAYFQNILSGKNGRRTVEVDVAGQELRNLEAPLASVAGRNLNLTIDLRLQQAADAGIAREIKGWNQYLGRIQISSGVVMAVNPKTGEILAMVSYPSYENNRLARFIPAYYYNQLAEDPRKPFLNHAVSDEYPPGSVFKLSTALGALNEGIVTTATRIDTPGILVLTESFSPNDPGFERSFVDWIYERNGVLNPGGFGNLDFIHCIAYSSNVCFYKLGGGFKDEIPNGLEIDRLREYARALGYDQVSGIELLGEADGLIPTRQWKRINRGENWSTGDTYLASVGQGYILATPLQVLMSAAAIANDGKLMKPVILRDISDNEGRILEFWENSDGSFSDRPAPGDAESRRISPFLPLMRWDMTVDPLIKDFICENGFCTDTGFFKTVQPFVLQKVQEGMHNSVIDPQGTLQDIFAGVTYAPAGKTGTAEYCDNVAQAANRCQFGAWPTHSWTVAYAPFDDPEIAVVAFAYNGGEGASVAGPMVKLVLDAYFELKAIDLAAQQSPGQ